MNAGMKHPIPAPRLTIWVPCLISLALTALFLAGLALYR